MSREERNAAIEELALSPPVKASLIAIADEIEGAHADIETSLQGQLTYEKYHRQKYQEWLIQLGIVGMGFGWSKDCDVPFDGACGCGANHPLDPTGDDADLVVGGGA